MILYISCSVRSCLGVETNVKEGFIHVSCNCKIFNTVSSPRFMRFIVSATFLLKYFLLSKCVRLFVLCCCVCCDGNPIDCRSSYGDVLPLSVHIQEMVMCLLWKATRRRLSVVQKYQDVKIIWALGTNTKTQSITLVVHTFCVLVYICVCDFSVCGCVYWQPWPFWSKLYASAGERSEECTKERI